MFESLPSYLNVSFQIIAILGGALGFFYAIRNDISILRVDIVNIKENQKALAEAFTQLGNILTKVAVQDTRLAMMEKKLDEFSHGKGYVNRANA